jgi:hypothetical protein
VSINSRLDALASTLGTRLPGYSIFAPDAPVKPTSTYPMIQVYPWREHTERTETGLWGNAMHEQSGSHGPDKYRIAILQSPLVPDLDHNAAKRALNDAVDTVRAALIQNAELRDDTGTAQALDCADHILVEWDGQGEYILWARVAYVGCYITVDVQKLREPVG